MQNNFASLLYFPLSKKQFSNNIKEHIGATDEVLITGIFLRIMADSLHARHKIMAVGQMRAIIWAS